MITYGAIKSGEQMVRVGGDVRDLDIHLPDIRPDQSAQPRENLHNDRIAEYAESMKAGDQFPPLTVFHDGEVYWLADGFHRFYAAQHAGRKHIRCYVRRGGLRDAILYSVGANAKHGLARSDEDKKRAVMRLLEDAEWSQWSDREIARRCRVSDKTVAKYRPVASADDPQIERKVQRGGTVYTQKVAKAADARKSRVTEGGDEKQEITSQTLAPQGGEGGAEPATPELMEIKASEPETVEHPATPFRSIFDELVSLWREADAGVRQDFKAYITGSEAAAKLNLRQDSNPAPGTGGDDVNRSAERASSAVEVGATNSPDGADSICAGSAARGQTALSGECPEAPSSPAEKMVVSETVANEFQSAVPTAEAAAETPMAPRPSAAANSFQPLSRADQVRLIRPHCQHPGTELCAGSGRNHCHACKRLMAESEAA